MSHPRIFDANVHFRPRAIGLDVHDQTAQAAGGLRTEGEMTPEDYFVCLDSCAEEFRTNFDSANFMFFNPNLHSQEVLSPVLKRIRTDFAGSAFTALVDFRRSDCVDVIRNLKHLGFHAIKFHPYGQQIEKEEMTRILSVCEVAEELGMTILVCTSFGTSRMHQHDGLALACRISEVVSRVPIVLLHSGGMRCFEAFLLAEDKPNVFLETSFSLNYWKGSRFSEDFMFIFKRLGSARIMYGSDFPYVGFAEARSFLSQELDRHGFSPSEQADIFSGTASRVFGTVS
ncbi:MAG TPA: amidohydrolase family protein [Leptospiraceae bacterium]|nr:amidohydrolase family protein [Leptospirales bacterium]HMY47483.1 amidohydrolase family protein [Leptospiraceae bacterium]